MVSHINVEIHSNDEMLSYKSQLKIKCPVSLSFKRGNEGEV